VHKMVFMNLHTVDMPAFDLHAHPTLPPLHILAIVWIRERWRGTDEEEIWMDGWMDGGREGGRMKLDSKRRTKAGGKKKVEKGNEGGREEERERKTVGLGKGSWGGRGTPPPTSTLT
jgi:hypothetical protein